MDKKLKIIIVSPAHPLRGGIASLSERLATELQHAGHEVIIYSFSLQYPGFLFPGKSQFTDDPPPSDLFIKAMISSINPVTWWRTGKSIALEKPDRIIVRYWLPFMALSLGSLLRVSRFFSRKNFMITGLGDNIIPHEKRLGDRQLSQYFVNACDDFLVMSKSVGDEIGQFTTKPVRFAPHPVYDNYGEPVSAEEARRALNLPINASIALFFGFIRHYKGLDILLEAIAQTPKIRLVIAGECYENWENYGQLIESLGISDRIHLFTDFIPTDRVRFFFSAADIVVQPYRAATQSGISQIAYHFNKPMIVTNIGGLPEIVTNGVSGYVVGPQPEKVSEALCDFFENQKSQTIQEGVRKEKARFEWPFFVDKLLTPPIM